MTPLGARLRALREERGVTLKEMAAALRVLRAMIWMKPLNTTAHNEIISTSTRKPATPLAMWTSKRKAIKIMTVASTAVLPNSAYSRPITIDMREIGVARNLSK